MTLSKKPEVLVVSCCSLLSLHLSHTHFLFCREGELDTVKVLVGLGADPKKCTCGKQTGLEFAMVQSLSPSLLSVLDEDCVCLSEHFREKQERGFQKVQTFLQILSSSWIVCAVAQTSESQMV